MRHERGGVSEDEIPGLASWPAEPAAVRRFLERLVAEVGFKEAHVVVASARELDPEARQIIEAQLARLEGETEGLAEEFREAARDSADLMLDESEREIAAVLASYGLVADEQTLRFLGTYLVKDEGFLERAIDLLLRGSKGGESGEAYAEKGENREALARAGDELLALQAGLDALILRRESLITRRLEDEAPKADLYQEHERGPSRSLDWDEVRGELGPVPSLESVSEGRARAERDPAWEAFLAEMQEQWARRPPPGGGSFPGAEEGLGIEEQLALLDADLRAARVEFHARWIELERQHPMLAAYRAGGRADAEALHGLSAAEGGEEALRALLATALPKVADIWRTRLALQRGELSPLELPPVVDYTRRRLRVPPGSVRNRVVEEAVAEARDDWKGWAIAAVTFGLAVLAAAPTGGSSLVIGAELAGLALDTYLALESIEDYRAQKAASNTAIDRAQALSSFDPSLSWLAARLASVPLNLGFAAKAIKEASRLRRAAAAGNAPEGAIKRLDDLGEAHGLGPIGSEIAEQKHPRATSAQSGGRPPRRTYSTRELVRRAEDRGPHHNFPQSFDDVIFENGERTVTEGFFRKPKAGLSDDSVQYRLRGELNGRIGTYEIFARPSRSGNTEVIVHRFFRPDA